MKKKELNKDELLKKGGKTVSEFKEFIAKGNVVDLAVGVIVGSAFGKIVSSIVDDILMPIIGMLIGGVDFSGLSITVGEANIKYGSFIQNVIDFFIIVLCIFFIVKFLERLTKKIKKQEEEEAKEEEPKKDEQIVLLEEIRDLLKNNSKE